MKLIVVGNWFGVEDVFKNMFSAVCFINNEGELDRQKGWFDKNAVILFGGGADISPSIYGHKASTFTGATDELSARDKFELAVFKMGKSAGSKFLGVCRGAQLLCATAGGSLYQHVDYHTQNHTMETDEGTVLTVSSAHHQMMNPEGTKHKLIGWSKHIRSPRHIVEGERNVHVEVEPEVIYFEDTNALAIQYHPEFMNEDAPAVKYSRDLVTKYLMEA